MRRWLSVACAIALLPLGAVSAHAAEPAAPGPAAPAPAAPAPAAPGPGRGVPAKAGAIVDGGSGNRASLGATSAGNTISGQVWSDDGDGVREDHEALREVEVRLWSHHPVNGWSAVRINSYGGSYAFTDVPQGSYQVQVWISDAFTESATRYGAGNDRQRDSDVFGSNVESPPVLFAGGGPESRGVDAGLVPGRGSGNFVKSAANHWCLDQEAPNGLPPTTGVGAYGCHGDVNQKWDFYWITTEIVEVWGRWNWDCLDQEHPDDQRTSEVGVHPCHGGLNQRWRVYHNELQGEPMIITNVRSGQCLDQESPHGPPTSGVGVYACHGGLNQKWYLAG
ncbi:MULTISPECIES: ricin-type beta-trefoil lectin domain protein [Actinosynnema]|uniref:ricin-type beta-trefoil lectin domain protein n=1 Tax=Actinosynnema TaxID=40566 RepID=UPI0020A5ECA8|nr:ricin-type beta-trefoil lectin domain protein [Actinosynnema pretiosum]MCP2095020.1 Ricin-type beta-trefoil lectin domain-containing protein [Actinosynnema pretiosum]